LLINYEALQFFGTITKSFFFLRGKSVVLVFKRERDEEKNEVFKKSIFFSKKFSFGLRFRRLQQLEENKNNNNTYLLVLLLFLFNL
jgi:hypothetical protein